MLVKLRGHSLGFFHVDDHTCRAEPALGGYRMLFNFRVFNYCLRFLRIYQPSAKVSTAKIQTDTGTVQGPAK